MQKTILILTVLILLCSFKGDIPVNPKFFGTWRCVTLDNNGKPSEHIIIIKQNSSSNKFDVYRKKDPIGQPWWTGTMLDNTHFKAKKDESPSASEEITHKITGYWDGNQLFTDDHMEKSIINNRAHSTSIYDFKRTFFRWDETTRKYVDKTELGLSEVTGGSDTKEGNTHSSFSSVAPHN